LELAIHIGYAKSATTYLQTKIFDKIKGVNYIGRRYGENIPNDKKLPWVYNFVFEKDFNASFYEKALLKHCEFNEVNLISHEVFLRPNYEWVMLKRIKKLSGAFNNIKIIFSIRNQAEIILSRYIHDKNGFSEKYDLIDSLDFEGTTSCSWPVCHDTKKVNSSQNKCICKKLGKKVINVPHYDYLRLWCLTNNLFNEKNVHIIVSENLRFNLKAEFENLCHFLGVRAQNSEFGTLETELVNSNGQQQKYINLKEQLLRSKFFFEIKQYFKSSNLVLSSLIENNFKKLGYL